MEAPGRPSEWPKARILDRGAQFETLSEWLRSGQTAPRELQEGTKEAPEGRGIAEGQNLR